MTIRDINVMKRDETMTLFFTTSVAALLLIFKTISSISIGSCSLSFKHKVVFSITRYSVNYHFVVIALGTLYPRGYMFQRNDVSMSVYRNKEVW